MNDFLDDKVEKIYKEIPELTNESSTESLQNYVEEKDHYFTLKPVYVGLVKM